MCNGAKEYGSDRSRKMLKNEYLLAKFGVDTEENELSKVTYLPPSPLSIKDLWEPVPEAEDPDAHLPELRMTLRVLPTHRQYKSEP